METAIHDDLFSSLISDIKSYTGNDPLLPWLRGIRKMRESLPPELLNEKLPRFLQKCAQTFESDRRYRNDLRFIRIWIQLMDYVDDPKALLRTMEMKRLGTKHSLFYQAYALYYEKMKKFEEADRMYRLGVQNLAEPMEELQRSYEQFVQRLERHKNKREGRTAKKSLSDRTTTHLSCSSKENENTCKVGGRAEGSPLKEHSPRKMTTHVTSDSMDVLKGRNMMPLNESNSGEERKLYRDDSVVVNFVDPAIVGRSEAEDAHHHGLVEPTINTKEAMNAINSMFREPIEPENVFQRTQRGQNKADQKTSNTFEVFVDKNSDSMVGSSYRKDDREFSAPQQRMQQPVQEPLKIFVDDEFGDDPEPSEQQPSAEGSPSSSSKADAFVFIRPNDHQSDSSNDTRTEPSTRTRFREDTVVCRFVGSAILEEPEVENICHHGLVDPTVNLKEAMDDINSMFGKPIDFARTTRRKRQQRAAASGRSDFGGFSILPDDDLLSEGGQQSPRNSSRKEKEDLFEPTVFTKEAMDDINNLFRMPL
uniref:BUB1 N-terminal domain-containing protein n=1 Tax=Opuntia streptacantha TaxID=393608 RepID=A0A7C9F1I9_OPUST